MEMRLVYPWQVIPKDIPMPFRKLRTPQPWRNRKRHVVLALMERRIPAKTRIIKRKWIIWSWRWMPEQVRKIHLQFGSNGKFVAWSIPFFFLRTCVLVCSAFFVSYWLANFCFRFHYYTNVFWYQSVWNVCGRLQSVGHYVPDCPGTHVHQRLCGILQNDQVLQNSRPRRTSSQNGFHGRGSGSD